MCGRGGQVLPTQRRLATALCLIFACLLLLPHLRSCPTQGGTGVSPHVRCWRTRAQRTSSSSISGACACSPGPSGPPGAGGVRVCVSARATVHSTCLPSQPLPAFSATQSSTQACPVTLRGHSVRSHAQEWVVACPQAAARVPGPRVRARGHALPHGRGARGR